MVYKLKKNMKRAIGGTVTGTDENPDYLIQLCHKHIKLFPNSKVEYDTYFDKRDKDIMYDIDDVELHALIMKYESIYIGPPKEHVIQKDTKLYHVDTSLPVQKNGIFFGDNMDDINKYIIVWKRQDFPNTEMNTYTYVVKNNIPVILLNFDYTVINFESFIMSLDPSYTRNFNILGIGNNFYILDWLIKNKDKYPQLNKYAGWIEYSSAHRVGLMTEIMLLGNILQYLELCGTDRVSTQIENLEQQLFEIENKCRADIAHLRQQIMEMKNQLNVN